jgi:hypothetical protein
VAVADLAAWQASLASALPCGAGTVTVVALTNSATITITWSERSHSTEAANRTLTFTTATTL